MSEQVNLVKSHEEVDKIRKASALSSKLHALGMQQKLIDESEISLLNYFTTLKESTEDASWAYPVIIGTGRRSTILHAEPSKKLFKDGELVLVDIGAKLMGYCSDITRVWPVGSRFSKEQKTIYEIVLKAQKEVIRRVSPGENLEDLHKVSQQYLLEGMLSKGVINSKDIERYFSHKTSHWIGREFHDKCPYHYEDGSPIKLTTNMCFTIEPGLYFKDTQSKYDGIGIRIEDVVCVTEKGCEVLSTVPKEIEEIEKIRSSII